MTEPSYLRRLRILADLSLIEAASAAGISVSQLSMAERGVRSLAEAPAVRLAQLYGSDPDVVAVAGGRVPSWMREQMRRHPAKATRAALDGFSLYLPPEPGKLEGRSDA